MLVVGMETTCFLADGGSTASSAHICMDVTGKRVWKLTDILKDNGKLSALITAEARRMYHYEAGKKQESKFNTEYVVPTDNFTLANNGIMFCYNNPDESFWANEVRIFVGYDQMKDLLTSDFKKRMKL
jgi:hypothetical protein